MASVAILDGTLRGGRVETDPLGLPFGRTGSFAITFKIAAGGSNYAFRCFLQNRATIHERYDAISSHLKNVQLPYFVDFTYLNEGIRVESFTYPTVRMSWAGGLPMGMYIQNHHADTGRMTTLQQQIQDMALALSAAGLAHGDIQGGNVLVSDGGEIKLVDYDGMYVPSIAALGAIETGHPNFQHPERASSKPFAANVDQFSFQMLHTVIAALIERPSLWNDLKSDPDKILLAASDIADPFSSSAFAALKSLPKAGALARSLQAIAAAPYDQIPTFADFINQRNIPTSGASTRTRAFSAPNTASGATPWYANHIPANAATTTGKPNDDVIGNYVAVDPVIDASKPYEWVGGRPRDVELIGKVESAEIGQSGKDLPHARLILETGNPELTVDVWADGLRRIAEQGITIDESWIGQWISAQGIIQGPIGSPTGERYSMTITESQQLGRINVQQARWRLATGRLEQASNESASTASNSDTLKGLSGSDSNVARNTSVSTPPAASSGVRPSNSSQSPDTSAAKFWLIVGSISAALLLILILLGTGALRASTAAPQYETCISSDQADSYCVEGLTWDYFSCWQGDDLDRLVIQRLNSNGKWSISDRYVAVDNACDVGFPWTVEFSRTEAGAGRRTYRLYTEGNGTEWGTVVETLRVVVTEEGG
jgi:hypothetical protein